MHRGTADGLRNNCRRVAFLTSFRGKDRALRGGTPCSEAGRVKIEEGSGEPKTTVPYSIRTAWMLFAAILISMLRGGRRSEP
jgi:hypothetical protein